MELEAADQENRSLKVAQRLYLLPLLCMHIPPDSGDRWKFRERAHQSDGFPKKLSFCVLAWLN